MQIANQQAGVLYATTLHSSNAKRSLDAALSVFLSSVEDAGELLYSLYYEQEQSAEAVEASIDLAFNDEMLGDVERQWKAIVGEGDETSFMRFEDREGMNDYDDDDAEGF